MPIIVGYLYFDKKKTLSSWRMGLLRYLAMTKILTLLPSWRGVVYLKIDRTSLNFPRSHLIVVL
ncbi:hypothetical protein [Geminocystis sp. CENA526]|uniref:hypothetical protein n=1 Tax=Geminocystis sp. CENA526 TaxID=1355871 RepID=UPI003D6E1DDE